MICTVCKEDKVPKLFRVKKQGAAIRRVAQCRACEKERFNASRRERRLGESNGMIFHDRENWHLPKKPWPWPPGTKVFEDVNLRRL